MKQSDLIAFLKENLQRLKQTSPKFWKVWTTINSIILFIAGIPTIMAWMDISDLNKFLPDASVAIILKIIAFASAWGLFMSQLTVQSNSEVIVEGGNVISKPCGDLPFTEKKDEAKIIQTVNNLDAV